MSIIRLRAQQEPMRRRAQGIAVYRRDELRPRLEDSSLDWVRELTRMTASRQSCLLWLGFESESGAPDYESLKLAASAVFVSDPLAKSKS